MDFYPFSSSALQSRQPDAKKFQAVKGFTMELRKVTVRPNNGQHDNGRLLTYKNNP